MGKKKSRRKQRVKRDPASRVPNIKIVEDNDDVYDEVDKFNMEYDASILKLVKNKKPLAKEVLRVASEDDFSNDELIEEEEHDQSKEVTTTNKWGKRRQNYYGASYANKTGTKNDCEEEEVLELEEEDAMNRQHKLEVANSCIDYDQLIHNSKGSESSNQEELADILGITTKSIVDQNEAVKIGNLEDEFNDKEDSESNTSNCNDLENKNEPFRERRAITYEIRKNKGIPKDKGRRKGKQHSRVMKRHQFKKALIKRRSQVPDIRRELSKYDGEKRGIRISTIKSIKL